MNGKTLRRWILVADAGRARLFLTSPGQPDWELLHDLVHPESRVMGQQLLNGDSAGPFASKRQDYRAVDYRPSSAQDDEAERFAASLSALLTGASASFDELVLCAAPRFLGMLRKKLGKGVTNKITAQFAKDYTSFEPREVAEMLPL